MKPLLKALLFSLICSGCSYQVFPSDVLNGVDHNFDFARWRMVPKPNPTDKSSTGWPHP